MKKSSSAPNATSGRSLRSSRGPYRKWTNHELRRLRELWDDDSLTSAEIGKLLGRTAKSVQQAAAYYKLPPRHQRTKVNVPLHLRKHYALFRKKGCNADLALYYAYNLYKTDPVL